MALCIMVAHKIDCIEDLHWSRTELSFNGCINPHYILYYIWTCRKQTDYIDAQTEALITLKNISVVGTREMLSHYRQGETYYTVTP